MESLENREPLYPSLYEVWTKKVRADMEKEGTWPTGLQEVDIQILAEYLSRILREFWDSNLPFRWYETGEDSSVHREMQKLRHTRILRFLYEKIRKKGVRDRAFIMPVWAGRHSYARSWIHLPRDSSHAFSITPFVEFNNHASGI